MPAERRRTPGLRREEVAQRANISPTWYTWLEQGRGGAPSADVLDRISRALMLTDVEREHLFLVGLGRPPEVRYRAGEASRRACNAFSTRWTPARRGQDGDMGRRRLEPRGDCGLRGLWTAPPEQRNILRYVFLDPRARAAQYDWESVARFVLGAFRADAVARRRRGRGRASRR